MEQPTPSGSVMLLPEVFFAVWAVSRRPRGLPPPQLTPFQKIRARHNFSPRLALVPFFG